MLRAVRESALAWGWNRSSTAPSRLLVLSRRRHCGSASVSDHKQHTASSSPARRIVSIHTPAHRVCLAPAHCSTAADGIGFLCWTFPLALYTPTTSVVLDADSKAPGL